MALRNLVTKMRAPAAAALRHLPPPAPSASLPPAGTRRLSTKLARDFEGKHQAKKINLESATPEEIFREAKMLEQMTEESLECVRKADEKLPVLMKDMWGTAKLWFAAGFLAEVLSFTAFLREEKREVEPAK